MSRRCDWSAKILGGVPGTLRQAEEVRGILSFVGGHHHVDVKTRPYQRQDLEVEVFVELQFVRYVLPNVQGPFVVGLN